MSRLSIADELGIGESRIRYMEDVGVLPRYGAVDDDAYRARLEVILAADKAGISGRRIRRGIVIGEEAGMDCSFRIEILKRNDEEQIVEGYASTTDEDSQGDL